MATASPSAQLARQVLPAPLHRALTHVFAQQPQGCMLVGGTALAGYHAGHRRSDDIDLFVRDPPALQAAVRAIASLTEISTVIDERQRTPQFYDALCTLDEHVFTAQVVLDANLFAVGHGEPADDGVVVADLATLLKQKAATLVSRCSEKDLYDLLWLATAFPEIEPADLITFGAEIDRGVTCETVLLSLAGATLRESACHFSTTQSAGQVHHDIVAFQHKLMHAFDALARKQPVPPVGALIKTLRKRR